MGLNLPHPHSADGHPETMSTSSLCQGVHLCGWGCGQFWKGGPNLVVSSTLPRLITGEQPKAQSILLMRLSPHTPTPHGRGCGLFLTECPLPKPEPGTQQVITYILKSGEGGPGTQYKNKRRGKQILLHCRWVHKLL